MIFINSLTDYVAPILEVVAQVGICVVIFIVAMYILKLLKEKGINLASYDNVDFDIDSIVIKVVRYINQTLVNKLKSNSADGKLTEEQAEQAQSTALNLILKLLENDVIEKLISKYGDSGYIDYLKVLIENAVVDIKESTSMSITGMEAIAPFTGEIAAIGLVNELTSEDVSEPASEDTEDVNESAN